MRREASNALAEGPVVGSGYGSWHFATQPGGGVTVFLSDHVGVQVGVEARFITEFDDGAYTTPSSG